MTDSTPSDTRKRFPRIHHIVNGPLKGGGVTRDDIVLSGKEANNFFDISDDCHLSPIAVPPPRWNVVVQEKIDGANMGIFYDVESRALAIQSRSHRVVANSGSQWRGLDKFLEETSSEILALLFALPTIPQLQDLIRKRNAPIPTTATTTAMTTKTKQDENENKNINDDDDDDDDDENNVDAQQTEKSAGDWTLYGEWVLARHSVPYETLPAPFLAFDIHHAPTDTFLATEVVQRLLQKYCPSIHMVPLLKIWRWNDETENQNDDDETNKKEKKIKKERNDTAVPISWDQIHRVYHGRQSEFTSGGCCEGAMIRLELNGVLLRRCKAVHDQFRANIEEHWTAKEMIKNGIVSA